MEKRLAELEAEFGQALEESDGWTRRKRNDSGCSRRPRCRRSWRTRRPASNGCSKRSATGRGRCRSASGGNQDAGPIAEHRFGFDRLAKQGRWLCSELPPTAAVDTHRDFIVDADVIADANENTDLVPMVDRVQEAFGQRPEAVLADGLNATGPNIVDLEQRGVEFLSPLAASEPKEGNPAVRPDPRQPVPEELWPKLPISPHTKKLDKSGFVFVPEENRYYCPRGEALPFEKSKPDVRQGQKIILDVYRCSDCAGCPLAGRCVSDKNQGGRTITRDRFTPDRERHAAKMQQPEARTGYAHRFHAGETPFGWLKHVLGLRQFLLRGLEKFRMEWLWACTGYNLRKLILAVGRLQQSLRRRLRKREIDEARGFRPFLFSG